MSDPVTLGLASTAVGLVNGTISLFKQAKEAAKSSDDHELKDKLSEVFDEILNLKEAVFNLAQENDQLRKQLSQKAGLTRESRTGFYLEENDPAPLCPVCYERDQKLIHLSEPSSRDNRYCRVCQITFRA